MEKKNSMAKCHSCDCNSLGLPRILPGHFFPWCITPVKFLPIKLAPGVFPSRKIVTVAPRVFLGTPTYIATMYLIGTKERSPWLGALSLKFLEFKVSRLA